MSQIQGVDSEVGQLRIVLMHRPGLELQRIKARHRDRLLFGSLPWVSKARQEHDVLSQVLRDHGAEVVYFTELLQDALEYQPARDQAIAMAIADAGLGDELRSQLRRYLENLGPEQLTQVLIAGLTPEELRIGHGVVFELLDRHDFVLDPLPNLIFTKDSSFWIGDRVAIASLAAERRRRETDLASVVYRYHPRFAGTKWIYQSDLEHVDGGDVLMLAPGVVAIGVGQCTTPAGAERLARRLFDTGLAHSVLAVPIRQHCGFSHLDTVCAVVNADSVVMHPAVAYGMTAHTISPRSDGMRVSRPRPFLEAAAQAMGIERLRVIDTGTDQTFGQAGLCDDGGNVLAIDRGIVVSHERNSETNARLEAAGVQVIRVPSSELGSIRGGPRCMTCAIGRRPASMPQERLQPLRSAEPASQSAVPGIPVPSARPSDLPAPVPASLAASATPTQSAGSGGSSSVGLAPASLEPFARATPRPLAEAEDAEGHPDSGDYQHEQRQREQGLGHGRSYEDDEDDGYDQQQRSKHVFTLRTHRGAALVHPRKHRRAAGYHG